MMKPYSTTGVDQHTGTALSSTMSSLSGICEDSTFGAEGEDTPPTVPRRRGSHGSRSIATTETNQILDALESIHEETPQLLQITDDVGGIAKRSSSSSGNARQPASSRRSSSRKERRSHPNRSDKNSRTSEVGEHEPDSGRRNPRSRRPQSSSPEGETNRQERADQVEISRELARGPSSSNSSSPNPPAPNSDSMEDCRSCGSQEKLKDQQEIQTSSSRLLSSWRRDSSNINDNGDESSKETMVEERRRRSTTSIHHRRHQSSRSSSHRSSSSSRRASSVSSSSDWRSSSRSAGRSSGTSSDHDTSLEGSAGERPGAYRVSTHSTLRVMSIASSVAISEQSFAGDDEDGWTAATRSLSSSRRSSSNNTMVRAQVAPDLTEEIAAARDQGRTEVLSSQAANRGSSIVVVGFPERRRTKEENDERNRRKKKILTMACAMVCCLLILVGGVVTYYAVAAERTDDISLSTTADQGNEDSELLADVRFDPPTAADCASIANGGDVAGQADMFIQYVDMHIAITTDSEEDAAFLVTLLKQQLQLNLMPFLIGCDDNVGNVIGNGVVDSVSNSTSPCLFRANPDCLEVVLTIKIFLRRNENGSTVVQILSNIILGEDLNDTLQLTPTVEAATVSRIVPSTISLDETGGTPTMSPRTSVPVNFFGPPSPMPDSFGPTTEPTIRQKPTTTTPSPTMRPSMRQTPGSSSSPVIFTTSSPVLDDEMDITLQPFFAITIKPTPSRVPTAVPVRDEEPGPVTFSEPTSSQPLLQTSRPTRIPTTKPTAGPTTRPIPSSTPMPTIVVTITPTNSPTPIPTANPTSLPSMMASSLRTIIPSGIPTDDPSFAPSHGPSADHPSAYPTLTPSRMCVADTRIVPLFDAGAGTYSQVAPGAVSSSVQRFSCQADASTDIGIVRFIENECTLECLFKIPLSSFEAYCKGNLAGGFTFSIPGPFAGTEDLIYIGNVASDFDLTCGGGQLAILNFDSSAIGCYADAQQRAMVGTPRLISSTMTVQDCLDHCFQAGFKYAGLEGRRDCFCDNDYMRYGKIEDSRCNKNCVPDGMPCGGDWAMSVYPTGADGHDGDYTPVPSASPIGDLGCWREDPSMVVTSLNPVWVGHCIDRCSSLGKTYAGLHNKNKCYCGDSYQAAGVAVTCNMDCAGPCGGADSWTIYQT